MSNKPSGAQNRQAAKRKTGKVNPEWLARCTEIGPPPKDPALRVAWASELGAQFLHEVSQHATIDARERWKLGAEFIRTLGMTAVKALYEDRLRKLEGKVYGRRGKESDGQATGEDHEPT
jgi:hypothetical protein